MRMNITGTRITVLAITTVTIYNEKYANIDSNIGGIE